MKFVFKSAAARDQAIDQINTVLNTRRNSTSTPELSIVNAPPMSPDIKPSPRSTLDCGEKGKRDVIDIFAPLSRSSAAAAAAAAELPPSVQRRLPKVINIPQEMLVSKGSLHFVCLTIGSRGDIQPYIALGLGLMDQGHRVTIVTHEEYRDWIVGFGLGHRSAGGDPGTLMKLSVDHKVSMLLEPFLHFSYPYSFVQIFSADFFRESIANVSILRFCCPYNWLIRLLVPTLA